MLLVLMLIPATVGFGSLNHPTLAVMHTLSSETTKSVELEQGCEWYTLIGAASRDAKGIEERLTSA